MSLNVPYSKKDVDIRTLKCFIQPAEEEERPRRSKEEQNARIKRLQRQGIPMSAMDPDELNFKDPPIFVYADYEAMQSADVNIGLLWYVAKPIRRTIHMYFTANVVLRTF